MHMRIGFSGAVSSGRYRQCGHAWTRPAPARTASASGHIRMVLGLGQHFDEAVGARGRALGRSS